MNKELNKAFNDQINREYFSAFLYLAMNEWLEQHGFIGAAQWMVAQYNEEIAHAEGLYRWIQMHDGEVELQAIDKPEAKYDSILEVFEASLAHEQFVTKHIHELSALADEVKDQASKIFLDWYVMEQVEEEDNARANIDAIKICQNDPAALFAFDRSLMGRPITKPAIPYLE